MNATWSLDALYKGYDDPAFHINWPIKEGLIISAKDQTLPYINPMVRETESK